MKTILFVCSGNYCRSPLAEGLVRRRLKQAGYDGEFWIAQHYPAASSRTFLLSDLIGERWDVFDPGVQELEALRACRDSINRVISTGLPEMIRRVRGGA